MQTPQRRKAPPGCPKETPISKSRLARPPDIGPAFAPDSARSAPVIADGRERRPERLEGRGAGGEAPALGSGAQPRREARTGPRRPSVQNADKSAAPTTTAPCQDLAPDVGGPAPAAGRRAFRAQLHQLRDVARPLVPNGDRLAKCFRIAVDRDGVEAYRDEQGRVSWLGWYTCGRPQCPMCGAKHARKNQEQAELAMQTHQKAGGTNWLLTTTAPHTKWTDASTFCDKLYAARDWMCKHRQWSALRRAFGLDVIWALDYTYSGDNGHHFHFHALLFVDGALLHVPGPEGLAVEEWTLRVQVEERIAKLWAEACIRQGLRAPSREHGVRVDGGRAAGKYVAGWDLAAELTRADRKDGKGDTALQLLQRAAEGDRNAAKAWQEYERAAATHRTIEWSRGLKARTLASDQVEPAKELIATFTADDARLIARRSLHAAMADAGEVGGRDAMLAVLADARRRESVLKYTRAPPTEGARAPPTALGDVLTTA